MGRSLYNEGNGAFIDERGVPIEPGIDEPVHWAVLLLSKGAHGFWTLLLPVSLFLLITAGAIVLTRRRPLSLAIAAGAALAALGWLAAWLLASAAGAAIDGPVDREILLIARDGAWLGLRNSFATGIAAIAFGLLLRIVTGGGLGLRWRQGLSSTDTRQDAPRFF